VPHDRDPTRERIVARSAEYTVIARVAVQGIITGPADERIMAAGAVLHACMSCQCAAVVWSD
jgi:hypothetical protein